MWGTPPLWHKGCSGLRDQEERTQKAPLRGCCSSRKPRRRGLHPEAWGGHAGPVPRPAARLPGRSRRGGAVPASRGGGLQGGRAGGPRAKDPGPCAGLRNWWPEQGPRRAAPRSPAAPSGQLEASAGCWPMPGGLVTAPWKHHTPPLHPAQGAPIAGQPPNWPRAQQSQANTAGDIPSLERTAGLQLLL